MTDNARIELCGCVLSLEDGEIQGVCDRHDMKKKKREEIERFFKSIKPGVMYSLDFKKVQP